MADVVGIDTERWGNGVYLCFTSSALEALHAIHFAARQPMMMHEAHPRAYSVLCQSARCVLCCVTVG
jgi:hypothetical protein